MDELQTGEKVILTILDKNGKLYDTESKIQAFYKDRIAVEKTEDILNHKECLEEGEDVNVKIFTPVGVILFNSIVLNSPLEDEFVVEYIETSPQVQRREYARVPIVAKVLIERSEENIVTKTINISGGGLRFFYEGTFEKDEQVKVCLYLPDLKMIKAKAKMIYNPNLPENNHVLNFEEIEETDRENIIKKCFEAQINVE